jgi:hypothetical protein
MSRWEENGKIEAYNEINAHKTKRRLLKNPFFMHVNLMHQFQFPRNALEDAKMSTHL